jgi:hypothetical protein
VLDTQKRRRLWSNWHPQQELSRNCRWKEIISLYHPVEEKTPELDQAGMADKVKEKIAFAMGQLKQFDDAIGLLLSCIQTDPDNFYTRSSLAYTAYSSLFAAKNREIFLAGIVRIQGRPKPTGQDPC